MEEGEIPWGDKGETLGRRGRPWGGEGDPVGGQAQNRVCLQVGLLLPEIVPWGYPGGEGQVGSGQWSHHVCP